MKIEEKDIRPKKIFDRFLHLSILDIKKYFNKSKKKVNCVACGRKGKFSFKKENFTYCECKNCNTLFVNPRPKEEAFLKYYTKSTSIKFLTNNLYKKTKEARKNKIVKPKAKMIYEILKEKKMNNCICVDIGGGYGIFAKEISKLLKKNAIVIEPSPSLAQECKKKKINSYRKIYGKSYKKRLASPKKGFYLF